MSSRNLFAAILMACLLTVGGFAPVANAASAGQSLLNPGKSAGNNVIEIGRRGHGVRIYPIAPSYLAYDYPYYYSRGYYPRYIGPGYIYNGYPSYSRSDYYPRYGGRCSRWHRRCAANWGYGNEEYYGCMEDNDCE